MTMDKPFPAATSDRLPEGVRIQPRRFEFERLDEIPQYWFAGNAIVTHVENAFSILIPPGERFFIQAVKSFEDRASDSETQALITAFVQQEGLHSRAHNEFNASFERFGVDVAREAAYAKEVFACVEKYLPKKLQLGATAFLEHLTAVGAHLLFVEPKIGEWMHPEALRFWRWHAAEELEHKAVAFDLFRKVGGGYALRIFSAVVALVLLAVPFNKIARRMIKGDPNPIDDETRRQAREIQRHVMGAQLRMIGQYFKPSFHPWDFDDEKYLNAWYASPEGA